MKSADEVAADQALQTLRTSGESDFGTMGVPSDLSLANIEDVTSLFLEPAVRKGPPLKESSLFVYRGIIRKLQGTSKFFAGLLGGCRSTVLDVILVETNQALNGSMACPELQKRWGERGYELLGLSVWGDSPPDEYICHLDNLGMSGGDAFLLQVTSSGTVNGWEITLASELELEELAAPQIIPVEVAMDGRNRKKGDEYMVVPIDFLGITMKDQLTFLATQAVRTQAAQIVLESKAVIEKALQAPFHIHKVPPDGKCCWHSIAASFQLDKYLKIPRRTSGFAINNHQEKAEEKAARSLLELALASEFEPPQGSSQMEKTGTVDLADLHWVGKALGISIRCTVSEQAGSLSKKNMYFFDSHTHVLLRCNQHRSIYIISCL